MEAEQSPLVEGNGLPCSSSMIVSGSVGHLVVEASSKHLPTFHTHFQSRVCSPECGTSSAIDFEVPKANSPTVYDVCHCLYI